MEALITSFDISKIKSVEYIDCNKVYDIEVKSNHNYYLQDNVLVHNSGKTHHIILKLIAISFIQQYNHIVYVNKIFGDIRKNQFKDIIKVLKATNLLQYFTINKTNYGFKNNITGTEFTALGMDNAENTKGLSDPTIIWWDEINKGTEDDFNTLNKLLRTPLNNKYQFIISFNPVSEYSWLRKFFFSEKNAYELNENFINETLLNHSTYKDNDFIDKEQYLLTLQKGDPRSSQVDIQGLWGSIENKAPAYYSYQTSLHYNDAEYTINSSEFIDLSFDFNTSYQPLLVGQHNRQTGEFTRLDLLVSDSNTASRFNLSALEHVCLLFQKKYIDTGLVMRSKIRVTGDPSGNNSDTNRERGKTSFYIIAKALNLSVNQIFVRKSHVTHEFSLQTINYAHRLLRGNLKNRIEDLHKEIQLVYIDDKGTINEAKKQYGLHTLDADRYLLDYWFGYTQGFMTQIKNVEQNIISLAERVKRAKLEQDIKLYEKIKIDD